MIKREFKIRFKGGLTYINSVAYHISIMKDKSHEYLNRQKEHLLKSNTLSHENSYILCIEKIGSIFRTSTLHIIPVVV